MAFRWEENTKGDKPEHRMLTPNGYLAAVVRPSDGALKGFNVWTACDINGRPVGCGVCKSVTEAKAEVEAEVLRQRLHEDVRHISNEHRIQLLYSATRRFIETLPQYPEMEFPRPMLPLVTAMRDACANLDPFPVPPKPEAPPPEASPEDSDPDE